MIQLTKQSSNNEIQLYFEKVRALRLSKEEFPVNFDEVWPLVYETEEMPRETLLIILLMELISTLSKMIRSCQSII